MKKKKRSPIAQADASPTAVSISSIPSPAEAQNRSKAPYVPPVYPYTPSRHERREYVHAKLKGEPVCANEPTWVKRHKANHDRNYSQSTSAIFSASPQGPTLSSPGDQPSPTAHPSASRTQIPPPPKLQPLTFANPPGLPLHSITNEAAHSAWWACISNNLASYSARSYHLFVASSFLTCKTEELLLLYEVRKLNADGKMLFDEVLRGLRARAASWEGSIDELRISWDMEAKREMVERYDAFVVEQVVELERELGEHAGGCDDCDDDAETVVNSHPWQGDCAVEGSSIANSPTETSRLNDIDGSWEGGGTAVAVAVEERKDRTIENSLSKESSTDGSTFNWADDANETFQDECITSVEGHKGQEDAVESDYIVDATLVNISTSSPIEVPQTWAEVLASPAKVQNCVSDPEKRCDATSSNDWGVSGEAWDWERNWR